MDTNEPYDIATVSNGDCFADSVRHFFSLHESFEY